MTDLRQDIAGRVVRADEPLAPHTTYKIGGPADFVIEVATRAALPATLAELAAAGIPWTVLGNGSNVLVSDAGVAGAVLVLTGEHTAVSLERGALGPGKHRVVIGAGASMTRLMRLAKEESLSELWALAGIPGTLGGAVRMNAGTRYGELSQVLVSAELCGADGYRSVPNDRLGLAYRRSELPAGAVVASVELAVGDADATMRDKLDEVLAYRKATQPLHLPSCGSVFANPPGDAAGRLIEQVGLKGAREGGAEVSTQHANWIVNHGGATARDVHALIVRCRRAVAERFGVALHPEVQLVGRWSAADREALR